jgi:RNA polymerase sigma-70 factor (ECF subfamily)
MENELVARARAGDRPAFRQLVSVHASDVYNFCYRLLGEPNAAARVSRHVFREAHNRLPRAEIPGTLGCWFLAIAYEHCLDRTGQLGPARDTLPSQPMPAIDGEEQPSVALRSLLRTLSILDRSVVVLRYWGGLSYDQIACVTGESVADVASRLHRARRRMLRIAPQ